MTRPAPGRSATCCRNRRSQQFNYELEALQELLKLTPERAAATLADAPADPYERLLHLTTAVYRQDCDRQQALQELADQQLRGGAARTPTRKRPATVNERMLAIMQADPSTHGWTTNQWCERLKCAKATVNATLAWKQLTLFREKQKAERGANRRHRVKGR